MLAANFGCQGASRGAGPAQAAAAANAQQATAKHVCPIPTRLVKAACSADKCPPRERWRTELSVTCREADGDVVLCRVGVGNAQLAVDTGDTFVVTTDFVPVDMPHSRPSN